MTYTDGTQYPQQVHPQQVPLGGAEAAKAAKAARKAKRAKLWSKVSLTLLIVSIGLRAILIGFGYHRTPRPPVPRVPTAPVIQPVTVPTVPPIVSIPGASIPGVGTKPVLPGHSRSGTKTGVPTTIAPITSRAR